VVKIEDDSDPDPEGVFPLAAGVVGNVVNRAETQARTVAWRALVVRAHAKGHRETGPGRKSSWAEICAAKQGAPKKLAARGAECRPEHELIELPAATVVAAKIRRDSYPLLEVAGEVGLPAAHGGPAFFPLYAPRCDGAAPRELQARIAVLSQHGRPEPMNEPEKEDEPLCRAELRPNYRLSGGQHFPP